MARAEPYQSPVAELLTLGDPSKASANRRGRPDEWSDCASLGLTEANADELIRMATDRSLHRSFDESRYWAPVHAWRAIGQLRCKQAIQPLVDLLNYIHRIEDDWGLEEIPEVLAMIGPASLDPCARFLETATNGVFARVAAARAMTLIAEQSAEHRDAAISAMCRVLRKAKWTDEALNGLVITYLMDLNAVEAVAEIEQAFAIGRVDVQVCGDWEEVRRELGVSVP